MAENRAEDDGGDAALREVVAASRAAPAPHTIAALPAPQKAVHRRSLPAAERTAVEREETSWRSALARRAPILEWAPKYGRDCKYHEGSGEPFKENLRRDTIAGVVIGVMLVPQGMAYALLAGLPPVYGLYSSTWTLVAYMVFGTCRLLGPGVNAPISLLVADSLQGALGLDETCADDVEGDDCAYFVEQSLLLCLVVGVLYLAMAAANLGVVTAFMPEPALSGFTTGAAAIIITSNVKYFLGMTVPRRDFVGTWVYIFQHLGDVSGWTLCVGLFAFGALDRLKALNAKYKDRLPAPIPEQLVVLVLTTVVTWAGDLKARAAVGIVGDIPGGLFTPSLPPITAARLGEVAQPAVIVALVTYILTINVAKAVGSKHNINVDATQELVALAAQSLVGGVTGSVVPSGSFSRTALVASLGAESALHNAVACVVVLVVTLTLTGALYHLPTATLAAIIFMALKAMINFDRARFLYRVSRREFAQWAVAFLVTTFGGVTYGIAASIALSIFLLLKQAARPTAALLGPLPGAPHVYVPLKRHPGASSLPGVKILRFDGPLTFANKDYLEQRLAKVDRQDTAAEPARAVILDCGACSTVDTSAARALERVVEAYAKKDRVLLLANWRGVDEAGQRVLDALEFENIIPKEHLFLTVAAAVAHAAALESPGADAAA